MKKMRIAVLPGDGVGPEVTREAVRVLRAVAEAYDHRMAFDEYPIGGAAIRRYGTPLPQATVDGCRQSSAVLLGAVGSPEFAGLPPAERPEAGLLRLRKALGGYANLRPVAAYHALEDCTPLRLEHVRGTDILVVRELLGGLYFGEPRGHTAAAGGDGVAGAAFNTMRYSAAEVERVARVAFEAARKRRGKVTSVDKANVLETSQLWRQVVSRVGREYPQVALEHLYVDTCAMLLISNPHRFDVILTENLFGDILSDEAAVLAGSLGLLASATVGGESDLYEPVHGSAPDIAGRDLANPIGAMASAALLLRYTGGLDAEALDVEWAIREVLSQGYRTAELPRNPATRTIGTAAMGSLVAQMVADRVDQRHPYHAV
jgi:3-isopropylmalate dehydrogenase